ncbi:MAG TPA: L,D-transpeptidase, partial [Ruminococcaceae bacterium]|nr:L,D-transpeptidase [Oscillospiraceae bacterium]HBQ46133.1 L,D-transpeptidase [Oscillospiraceae bacterium]
ADKLGEPASHGCIRLPVEDAKWIYDNIPEGTKVVIE